MKEVSPLHDLTWECHVCGRTRPDENIAVMIHRVENMAQNVRYCRDEPECEHTGRMYNLMGLSAKSEAMAWEDACKSWRSVAMSYKRTTQLAVCFLAAATGLWLLSFALS